ncbi:Oidioi.mRNA.OKI2018_I69.chr2.g7428.t1.cds [Oikopleura dioica]|uniref:Oidioi.mRNA.OKI2018_I69.chr2.g7428.t1.cds n=1 Tax=Oikopleura dioica TaxID=34765 RepID=A0ABN7TD08_OIKDI|nr:Oidioi.mRNA.OKI2018_I69.chr2.g7428.t1.cds [Oikopleura dioica]
MGSKGYKKSYGKAAYKNKYNAWYTDVKDFMWLLMQNLDVLMSALMLVLVFYIFLRRKFTNWKPGKKS